jgi:hypothetical protein
MSRPGCDDDDDDRYHNNSHVKRDHGGVLFTWNADAQNVWSNGLTDATGRPLATCWFNKFANADALKHLFTCGLVQTISFRQANAGQLQRKTHGSVRVWQAGGTAVIERSHAA